MNDCNYCDEINSKPLKEGLTATAPWKKHCVKYRSFTWCGNVKEKHSFRIVLGNSPETMRNLCFSTKFLHQEIMWNYRILRSAKHPK